MEEERQNIAQLNLDPEKLLGSTSPWSWDEFNSEKWKTIPVNPPITVKGASTRIFGQVGAKWLRLHLRKSKTARGSFTPKAGVAWVSDLIEAYSGTEETWTEPMPSDTVTVQAADEVTIDAIAADMR